MIAGTTLTPWSGRIIGTHQKIDRVARHHLKNIITDNRIFPSTKMILHFEGFNGPDSIKRKSPAKDEPWHFYSPFDDDDSKLIELISQHYGQLVKDLKEQDRIRAAFEAAWLSHAIVDGLTPAHHYPFEKKLSELRGGEGIESRNTIKNKIFIQGETNREIVNNNWKMYGPKGLFSTHFLFELGVAFLTAPLSFNDAAPTDHDIKEVLELGINEIFKRRAREIAILDMYELYYKRGWTIKLMIEIRQTLLPIIIRTVTLAWYSALYESGSIDPSKFLKT